MCHGGLDGWSLDSVPRLSAEWFPVMTLANEIGFKVCCKSLNVSECLWPALPCVVLSTNRSRAEGDTQSIQPPRCLYGSFAPHLVQATITSCVDSYSHGLKIC